MGDPSGEYITEQILEGRNPGRAWAKSLFQQKPAKKSVRVSKQPLDDDLSAFEKRAREFARLKNEGMDKAIDEKFTLRERGELEAIANKYGWLNEEGVTSDAGMRGEDGGSLPQVVKPVRRYAEDSFSDRATEPTTPAKEPPAFSYDQDQQGKGTKGVLFESTPETRETANYDIEKRQRMLINAGVLSEGAASGMFDDATVEAVKAFQKQNNIPVTGKIDDITDELLSGVYA